MIKMMIPALRGLSHKNDDNGASKLELVRQVAKSQSNYFQVLFINSRNTQAVLVLRQAPKGRN